MKERIYLDNAATTVMPEAVLQAMLPYFRESYANPSAIYGFAGEAKKAVRAAREQAAALIGAQPTEIYFTAGGTESDNWAIRAAAEGLKDKGRHIVTTKIEHHAVLHTCRYLERQGYEVTYLDVDGGGKVAPEAIDAAIRRDTILISVMAANNEIGTLEPIAQIGEIARRRGVLFHTDAVQAYGHIPLDVEAMQADLLSASGHKFGGPKGAGILYCRENVRLRPLLYGGAQERGRRAGTLNVPGIVGFGKAAALAGETLHERMERERALRDRLIGRVLREIPDSRLCGSERDRLPGNAHFCFLGVEAESLLILLDQRGICASGGSACASGSQEPSHVLSAIGISGDVARGALRLTLSAENTEEEIDETAEALKECVGRLREYRIKGL
ncbi:MAG: cysteine desulfurase NifS [Ruminococcus flavefaciens]|nr:cysteine desulfurase NifS [Ruminococcus flavefaciens]